MTVPLRRESDAAARAEPRAVPAPPPRLLKASWVADVALSALRVVSGFMLMQHGVQKHFGWLLPADQTFRGTPEAFSSMWVAGTLEIAGGFLLLLGLFTRPVAFVLSGLMAFAYFIAHAPRGFWPILNQGELAALYCFVFLALSALGGGRLSLDNVLRHRPRLLLIQ
ncbi:MAG: DoxX family protein [Gemmatimonadaceae bacterium]